MAAEGILWSAHAKIEKFSPAQVAAAAAELGRDPDGGELRALCGEPEDGVQEEPGNILVTAGLGLISNLIEGAGGTPFAHADAIVGVGATATAATIADVHLGADGGSAYYQQADTSYPTASGGVITAVSTFASVNANFAWNEWCLATGSGGITAGATLASVATTPTMLNHKIASLGTKASGAAWVFTATITLS